MRRVVVLFVLVAAVLTAACGPSESSTGNEDGGDATEKAGTAGVGPSPRAPGYFFIGNDMGMPRPCGCSKPALGGIVRRMGFFESLPEGVSKGSLLVSGGNLIHEGGRQQELKLETFLQELDALGAAGMYTKRAKLDNVRIVDKSTLPPRLVNVNVKDIMLKGAPNPVLHENDIVYVHITIGGWIIQTVDDILSPLRSVLGAHQFATQQLPAVAQ